MLEFADVTKTYGRPGKVPPALDGVSFAVDEGELVLLVGPSGAGKSTLIRLVLAAERPDAGVIRVAGRDISRLRRSSIPYLRRNVGVVFQDFKLIAQASARENVELALQALGWPRAVVRERAAWALASVEMADLAQKPVCRLSGGEQQRVAIARALAAAPPILLADEPTGNLDPHLTAELLELLARISAQGTTVVLATHDPAVVSALADARVLRLEAGRLVADRRGAAGPWVLDGGAPPEAAPSDTAQEAVA
ncbi:MAG: ATP-binding cassette domain-containing protein [Deltaproteobacteria bacterium]|nr:MAG: ATP-binding cassette domain-containing protein [Deltaproteobacteria bacterium]